MVSLSEATDAACWQRESKGLERCAGSGGIRWFRENDKLCWSVKKNTRSIRGDFNSSEPRTLSVNKQIFFLIGKVIKNSQKKILYNYFRLFAQKKIKVGQHFPFAYQPLAHSYYVFLTLYIKIP